LSQIFLTDARTFICCFLLPRCRDLIQDQAAKNSLMLSAYLYR
jgi:hypothetical protein